MSIFRNEPMMKTAYTTIEMEEMEAYPMVTSKRAI